MKTLIFPIVAGLLFACRAEPVSTASAPPAAPAGASIAAADATSGAPARRGDARERSGKPSAPVDIAARVGAGEAEIAIVFRVDASDVAVEVWGTGGLAVKRRERARVDAVAPSFRAQAGDTLREKVTFTAPAGTSQLAVSVAGVFGGKRQTKVRSFTLGDAGSPPPAGEVQIDASGRPIEILRQAP